MTEHLNRTVELNVEHDLVSFDCGVPELNSWLHNSALKNQRDNTSRTFVLLEGTKVIAFYFLATASTERESLPNSKQRNSPRDVPLISLGRLAVAIEFQGLGLGAHLFERVEGDYFSVLGLPLLPLLAFLREQGAAPR